MIVGDIIPKFPGQQHLAINKDDRDFIIAAGLERFRDIQYYDSEYKPQVYDPSLLQDSVVLWYEPIQHTQFLCEQRGVNTDRTWLRHNAQLVDKDGDEAGRFPDYSEIWGQNLENVWFDLSRGNALSLDAMRGLYKNLAQFDRIARSPNIDTSDVQKMVNSHSNPAAPIAPDFDNEDEFHNPVYSWAVQASNFDNQTLDTFIAQPDHANLGILAASDFKLPDGVRPQDVDVGIHYDVYKTIHMPTPQMPEQTIVENYHSVKWTNFVPVTWQGEQRYRIANTLWNAGACRTMLTSLLGADWSLARNITDEEWSSGIRGLSVKVNIELWLATCRPPMETSLIQWIP